MKPALTILYPHFSLAEQYRVCILVEVTNIHSREPEFVAGDVEFRGTLDQCAQYVMDKAHQAGYMEAAKKAINAISDAL